MNKNNGSKKGKSRGKNKRKGNSSHQSKRKFTPGQVKQAAVDKQTKNPKAGMRLNKYISNSGVCSRREADIYIASGNVTVNGEVITQMGYKVQLSDEVKFDGRRINPERKEYILLNKPAGFYVTGSYEQNNRTVMDLVAKASKSRIVPVGKLGTSAKGLLLFTNDGTLEKRLARKGTRQIFEVELTRDFEPEDLDTLREGIYLRKVLVKPREVSYVNDKSKRFVGVELRSAVPEVMVKTFRKLGYEVKNLDRVVYGGLTKKNLPRGKYRTLTKQEIINLGM